MPKAPEKSAQAAAPKAPGPTGPPTAPLRRVRITQVHGTAVSRDVPGQRSRESVTIKRNGRMLTYPVNVVFHANPEEIAALAEVCTVEEEK